MQFTITALTNINSIGIIYYIIYHPTIIIRVKNITFIDFYNIINYDTFEIVITSYSVTDILSLCKFIFPILVNKDFSIIT
jgi:hypothetical protein